MEMRRHLLYGLEVELLILANDGALSPSSEKLVNHKLNNGYIIPEYSKAMIEIVPPPAYTLQELSNLIISSLELTNRIAETQNCKLSPASIFSEGELTELYPKPEYRVKRRLFTEEENSVTQQSLGTHLHIDRMDLAYVVNQLNFMTAMDPAFVFLSATPIAHSKHYLKDHRVFNFRHSLLQNYPQFHQLRPYFADIEEIRRIVDEDYHTWCDLLRESGCPQDFIEERYTKRGAHWGPLRYRKKTLEVRSGTTSLTSYILAFVALYRGVMNRLVEEGLQVKICGDDEKEFFVVRRNKVSLPSFKRILQFEKEGYTEGLANMDVYNYLKAMVLFSKEGLSNSGRYFLTPFYKMLDKRETLCDQILKHLNQKQPVPGREISFEEIKELRLMLHDWYIEDLHSFRKNLKTLWPETQAA